jgi:hypothetical protein
VKARERCAQTFDNTMQRRTEQYNAEQHGNWLNAAEHMPDTKYVFK